MAVCQPRARMGRRGLPGATPAELREALENAHRVETFSIIDVRVERDDLSPVTVKYIKAAAKRSQAPPSERQQRWPDGRPRS